MERLLAGNKNAKRRLSNICSYAQLRNDKKRNFQWRGNNTISFYKIRKGSDKSPVASKYILVFMVRALDLVLFKKIKYRLGARSWKTISAGSNNFENDWGSKSSGQHKRLFYSLQIWILLMEKKENS